MWTSWPSTLVCSCPALAHLNLSYNKQTVKKPDPTEEALSALRALERANNHAALSEALPAYLRNRSAAVVARAASLVVDLSLTPNLIEAFRKILPDPVKRDPGCRALTAIATALTTMEAPAAEIFSIGIRHQQWEGSFGPPIDTAAGLRAVSAMGLAVIGDPAALLACCDLLNDHEADARIGAARALGASGKPEAELLLRFKAALGDEKSDVTSECFLNLLHLSPRSSVPYVARFLNAADEDTAHAALWALALSRHEAAFAELLARLESANLRQAAQILEALALSKTDEARRAQVRAILDTRAEPALEKIFTASWQVPKLN